MMSPDDHPDCPARQRRSVSPAVAVTSLSLVVSAIFLAGVGFDRLLVKRELRSVIERTRGNATLLDAIRRRDSPDFRAADILRVFPAAGESEEYLGRISWSPPPVTVPFIGTAPREGQSANATINRHHFRDARPDYGPKAANEVRIFLTGGSVAYGTGAASQEETVAGFLEKALNRDGAVGEPRYLVISTGVPGYVSTHERLLVELKVVNLEPDLILMLSGGNDVHWAAGGFDVRSLRTYSDAHVDTVVAKAYGIAGLDWPDPPESLEATPSPRDVALRLRANVDAVVRAARDAGARVAFALQPNVRTTRKDLSDRERRIRDGMPGAELWEPCYSEMRALLSSGAGELEFVDVSAAFEGAPRTEEWFIDAYHFGPQGNRALAERLVPVIRGVLARDEVRSNEDGKSSEK